MSDTPSWHPSRPEDPYLPAIPGEGSITVALVASAGALDDGWAAELAAGMARAWARSGTPTYLCDLALEAPELHHVLEMDNDEGVSDVLLYGASPRRVAHPIDPGFFFAPAGTATADPGAVRRSPRWDALVDGFADAGALLLLFVPAEADGVDAVLARADGVLVLRRADETVALGEAEERVLGGVGVARERDEPGPVDPPRAPAAPPPVGDRGPEPVPRRGWLRWFLVVLVMVVLVLVLIGLMGWVDVPGLGAEVRAGGATVEEPATPALDQAPLQAFGLTLEAHRSASVAEDRLAELGARWPERLFWRAPVEVGGEEYHRVLAGPATSRAEAEAVRAALGGREEWIVRDTHLAFLLGELPDLVAARTFAEVLGGLELPTHILLVPADGASRAQYRVYAGSYASDDEAGALRALLDGQGLGSAPLTERRGIAPE